MKILNAFLFAALTLFLAASPPRANAASEVSVDLFYNALQPQGDWMEVSDYGYVWHPNGVSEDWRPYTDGHWVFTDAGWTFVSDEPWGWATYHYGRWVQLADVGWSWVPDTEWAPAWVSWRRSDKYVGWAPLPPEARFRRDVGFEKWVDGYYDIGPESYTFVETRRLGSPHLRTVIVQPTQNITIIRETTNITQITYRQDMVYVGGPDYEVISRESAEPIPRLRIERRTDVSFDPGSLRSERFASQVQGDRLAIVAPQVRAATTSVAPAKVTRTIQNARVEHGWQGISDQAQAQGLRAKIQGEAKAPASLPPKPKFERTAASGGAGRNAAPTGNGANAETSPAATGETTPATTRSHPGQRAREATAETSPTEAAATPKGARKGKAMTSPNEAGAESGNKGTPTSETSPISTGSKHKGAAMVSPNESDAATSPSAEKSARGKKGRGDGASLTPAAMDQNTSEKPAGTTREGGGAKREKGKSENGNAADTTTHPSSESTDRPRGGGAARESGAAERERGAGATTGGAGAEHERGVGMGEKPRAGGAGGSAEMLRGGGKPAGAAAGEEKSEGKGGKKKEKGESGAATPAE